MMSIIFCLSLIFIWGCTNINVNIKFQDIQTCQNFCNSINILWEKKETPCHETCQKLENSKNKIIEKPVKKIPAKNTPIIVPEIIIPEDCNKICTTLWTNNNQEKTNCIISCTNEITE